VITRRGIRVNRAATAWLIRRFVDPAAELFVEPGEVATVQAREGAIGFDAPCARYPHDDGSHRCSFEALAQAHRPNDRQLAARVARTTLPGLPARRGRLRSDCRSASAPA